MSLYSCHTIKTKRASGGLKIYREGKTLSAFKKITKKTDKGLEYIVFIKYREHSKKNNTLSSISSQVR